jgi:hypothetical protein
MRSTSDLVLIRALAKLRNINPPRWERLTERLAEIDDGNEYCPYGS